jgi:hypothetical protein
MGRCAAVTAASAFTMPAPHSPPLVGHAHSPLPSLATAGHTGRPVGCGKLTALASIRAINCAGVRLALTVRMSAAIPDTIGAEKLVPRLTLVSFVYVLVLGTVNPVLLVVSMDFRQGPEEFTQFPAGADTPTSAPKLL